MAEIVNPSKVALVSLGSNLSYSEKTPSEIFSDVIAALEDYSVEQVVVSSFYITSPVDSPDGTPDFLNAVVGITPGNTETPQSLLKTLQSLESNWGRARSGVKNEARTLDLDIISYKDQIVSQTDLFIPHPRAHIRKFVLMPLIELCGESVLLQGWEKTAGEFLGKLNDQEIALYKQD